MRRNLANLIVVSEVVIKMRKKALSALLCILLVVVILGGCAKQDTSSGSNVNETQAMTQSNQQVNPDAGLRSSNAKYIGNFLAIANEQKIEVRFSLLDASKKYVTADGVGVVRIVNFEGKEVYTDTINVKKEDFGTYILQLTGENFEAYAWEIPINETKKSASSTGTIYLNFKIKGSEFEEMKTDIWGLPTYSEEELAQINEEQFSKSSINVNQKVSKGSFEVTVIRVGFFTPSVKYGDKKEYFRMDIEVKNIGSKKEDFFPSGLVILDNQGNQYEGEYGGTLDTFSEIYPTVKKSGYILFKKIQSNSQSIKLVFELGYDKEYKPYNFEYNIPLTK